MLVKKYNTVASDIDEPINIWVDIILLFILIFDGEMEICRFYETIIRLH